MTNNPSTQDKRSCTRHQTKVNCAVMLTPGHILSYCILDISREGMAFCYDGQAKESMQLNDVVAAFIYEDEVLPEIFVQIISDTEMNKEKLCDLFVINRFPNRYLRRCGIKFTSLSHHQEDKIKTYIRNNRIN
jgi:c-di-GMP-binding flagellar brake protein YcgR